MKGHRAQNLAKFYTTTSRRLNGRATLSQTTGTYDLEAQIPDVPRTYPGRLGWQLAFVLISPRTLPMCSICSKNWARALTVKFGRIHASLVVLRDMQCPYEARVLESTCTPDPDLYDTHYCGQRLFLRRAPIRNACVVPLYWLRSMAIVRRGKQWGHLLSVGRVLARQGRDVLEPRCTHTADVDELKRTNKRLKNQMDMIMKVVRSDDRMSQLLTQLQSQNEVGSGRGSGGGGDDENVGEDEDEDADGDEDS
ncbi:hypothetical protein Tco_0693355 [Tanacetum coccineum]